MADFKSEKIIMNKIVMLLVLVLRRAAARQEGGDMNR